MGECILAGHTPSAGGKRTARFIVGTATAGWTSKDCDYLCDGTDDQVEINAAIQALPADGGEVLILDGIYSIAAAISMSKEKVKLSGNGNATILKRMWDSTTSAFAGVISIISEWCIVSDIYVDGNGVTFKGSSNHNIHITASNNIIIGNTCVNAQGNGINGSDVKNIIIENNVCTKNRDGIANYRVASNIISGNVCTGNTYGISLSGFSNNNTIYGNITNSNSYGIYVIQSSDNSFSGNLCNDNPYYAGICLFSSSSNTVSGNTCNKNTVGIHLRASSNNTITGNTCIRGTGTSGDYASNKYTIRLEGTENTNNLIAYNNIMGKNYTSEGGTGNTFTGNKYN